MEGFNPVPILIPLGALFFGWLIGFLDSNMRSSKKIKEAEARAEMAANEARAKIDQAAAAAAPPPGNSLLRLSLDEGGQTRLELDGQRVNAAVLAPEQRKRLIELMVTMRPWIEGSAPAQPPPPRPAMPSQPVRPAAPVSRLRAAPAAAAPAEVAAPTSMVGQIDAILQTRLAGTHLSERGVRLVESPDGGVSVMVGLQKFPGVGEVPDPEVQAAIRAAIAEWEKRFTPGL